MLLGLGWAWGSAETPLCGAAGAALIVAAWPQAGAAVDRTALAHFSALQATVKAIRTTRQEYGVEPARRVGAVLRIADETLREALAAELKVRAYGSDGLLLGCWKGGARGIEAGGVYVV